MKHFKFLFALFLINIYTGKAQSPNTDSLFNTVFVDQFDSMKISNWNAIYPWGSFFNSNISTSINSPTTGSLCVGATNFPSALAGPNGNLNDTNNFKFRNVSGVSYLSLTGQKESTPKAMQIWKTWYSCSGATCTPHAKCTLPCWGCGCVHDSIEYFKYTNAMLGSKKIVKYGYIEIKFRIPELNNPSFTYNSYYSGAPTFWMLGNSISQPYSELDIYEIDASNCLFTNNWHVYTGGVGGHNNNPYPNPTGPVHNINVGQWHTAGVNWTPKYLDYYLDDNLVRRQDQDSVALLDSMYIYIENYIPNVLGCVGIDTVNTPFPMHYDLDYVKIWQPKIDCGNDKVYTNVTQSSYAAKLYKSLIIGGTGYSATFTNGFTHFASNNGIELDEGFEVSSSGTALLEVLPCFTGMTTAYKPPVNAKAPANLHRTQ
ncbi:MAG TPA: family 16 glycosylhydrolase [Bacteroidia bacterium]|jgi:hypothetical protein|nr:family 16 glycosylhydrolase [Bacteroidia bacterium]